MKISYYSKRKARHLQIYTPRNEVSLFCIKNVSRPMHARVHVCVCVCVCVCV
jgi:hypothetical protein